MSSSANLNHSAYRRTGILDLSRKKCLLVKVYRSKPVARDVYSIKLPRPQTQDLSQTLWLLTLALISYIMDLSAKTTKWFKYVTSEEIEY